MLYKVNIYKWETEHTSWYKYLEESRIKRVYVRSKWWGLELHRPYVRQAHTVPVSRTARYIWHTNFPSLDSPEYFYFIHSHKRHVLNRHCNLSELINTGITSDPYQNTRRNVQIYYRIVVKKLCKIIFFCINAVFTAKKMFSKMTRLN